MIIALDHDGTYTRDPAMWDEWITMARNHGHRVICVTMRYPQESLQMPCEIVYTSRQAKAPYMAARNCLPDVWIDDSPHWIFSSSN
jgi:hypothetical protein